MKASTGTSTEPTAVIYTRTASRADEDAGLIAEQINACLQIAAQHGIEVVRVFADAGLSGVTSERPVLRALLEYLTTHSVDYLICSDINRLARDYTLYRRLTTAITGHGVRVLDSSAAATQRGATP
jgi:DNA invertase Pin-like site-specific DNA recombinase